MPILEQLSKIRLYENLEFMGKKWQVSTIFGHFSPEAIKKNLLQNLVTQWYDSPNHNHYNIRFNVCFPF